MVRDRVGDFVRVRDKDRRSEPDRRSEAISLAPVKFRSPI